MNARTLFVVLALAWSSIAPAAEVTVFIGSVQSNEASSFQDPCPDEHICLDGWFVYRITVEKILAGPGLNGTVEAAKPQHTQRLHLDGRRGLFVLTPIDDPERSRQIGVNYYLTEDSYPDPLYCTRHPLGVYGVPSTEPYSSMHEGRYCYQPEVIER